MILSSNGNDNKFFFGNNEKRWVMLQSIDETGNLQVEYIPDEKIYIISRIDGKSFDGTEDVGGIFLGNMCKPDTLEEKLEYQVDLLSGIQIEPEASMFEEFDWKFNEDKTKVFIYPVFLEKSLNVVMALKDDVNADVVLSYGARKKLEIVYNTKTIGLGYNIE